MTDLNFTVETYTGNPDDLVVATCDECGAFRIPILNVAEHALHVHQRTVYTVNVSVALGGGTGNHYCGDLDCFWCYPH